MAVPRINAQHRNAGIKRFAWWDDINQMMICLIDPKKVVADLAFQRPHDERHSSEMAEVGTLVTPYPICGFTNGVVDPIDGQHRIEMEIKKQKDSRNPRMYVAIKFDLTLRQKAKLYGDLNTFKRPDRWNTFQSRLTARHPDYVAMKNIAAKHGLTLKCDERHADLRNTHVMLEAFNAGLYEEWIILLTAFSVNGQLDKKASTNAIELQRGLLDTLRKYTPRKMNSPRIIAGLRQIGVGLIATHADAQCDCSRTNRSHYAKAIEGLLSARGLL